MDNARLEDLFESLGPISIRKLFGGKGIYCDGVIVAIVVHGELLLKADEESIPDFEAAGCSQWTYTGSRHGKQVAMPYWSVPDSAFDDPDQMAIWARRAYEAGRRAGT
ncbi:MAG: TfoX/Sxy family protein [Mesorhizobium sp.]|uniref:TfoX/Sxy family protein n=1 Tax=Mesorhizobium sp. TaxID=1871066 RepID=UPI00120E6C55|nr:TfoX/Sxy family protein [Mesorhizobium sp.]TIO53571.1 MAG: TfoX/Sxy family protein [Mesorhizobium sp.]TIO62268.1 MAG: TfoX/Sxy family protein [Mesorhizobium sp.]TJV66985.1 MAG: TfoX/Sxy family protein [Mesorhizobium sp.]